MNEGSTKGIDLAALTKWFAGHMPDHPRQGSLQASLVAGGRSNLTFSITDGEREWILRRPPLGHVLPTAHDMRREFTVLRALQETDVPVPRVDALCEDLSVIGAPFYLMEKVEGIIVRSADDSLLLTAETARACSIELIDVLVRIHGVDWHAVGLQNWGRPDGYLARQLRRWRQQWERSKARELPGLLELDRRLTAALPASHTATVVHGDYRLDNVVFDASARTSVVAVLDWEMSTLGDPLADLGLLMVYWDEVDDERPPLPVATRVTARPGFLRRGEMVEEYVRRSGRAVHDLPFYVALGYYKLAIILESIHRRYELGYTVGDGFDQLGAGVPLLIEVALDTTSRSDLPALRG